MIPAGGVVATPVYCRRCGYNLYSLPADGACPECGLDTWESILHTVDPAASRLPRLRDPGAVGNALLWLMVCLVGGSLLLVLRYVTQWIDALDPTGVRQQWAPIELSVLAGLLGLAALPAVRQLVRPAGEESDAAVHRDVRLLGYGLAAWATLILLAGGLEELTGPHPAIDLVWLGIAGAAIVALLGVRGVLRVIGLRSREYRTARGGRQGIRAMIAAIAGLAAGQVMRLLAGLTGIEVLTNLGIAVSAICTLMVVIGLFYLVVNAWWIRRSLRCPPPRLDEILSSATS